MTCRIFFWDGMREPQLVRSNTPTSKAAMDKAAMHNWDTRSLLAGTAMIRKFAANRPDPSVERVGEGAATRHARGGHAACLGQSAEDLLSRENKLGTPVALLYLSRV